MSQRDEVMALLRSIGQALHMLISGETPEEDSRDLSPEQLRGVYERAVKDLAKIGLMLEPGRETVIEEIVRALSFYGDPESYRRDDIHDYVAVAADHGRRAREALAAAAAAGVLRAGL